MAIVLFTDFGASDIYAGQVRAVLAARAPGETVIDLLHQAPAYDPRAAAHLLAALVPRFPQGSVFLAVVDPGVGSSREALVIRAGGYRLVGPDNGLLSVFAGRASHAERFRIAWKPPSLSSSFHGRDLFAPMAARIATGLLAPGDLVAIERLGVDFGPAELAEIIYVDHYGNAMTGLLAANYAENLVLRVRQEQLRHSRVFCEVSEGQAFWYENSLGLIEIAANRASAASRLGLAIGDAVSLGGSAARGNR